MSIDIGQLAAGDILCKKSDGSVVSNIIAFVQVLASDARQHASITHAGVVSRKDASGAFVVEAQGPGLCKNDLLTTNASYNYLVFRSVNANVAEGIATVANLLFDVRGEKNNLRYNLAGAAASCFRNKGAINDAQIDALIHGIIDGSSDTFFCSEFVVFCCRLVDEQMRIEGTPSGIPASFFSKSNVPPAELVKRLVAHPSAFTYVGELNASA